MSSLGDSSYLRYPCGSNNNGSRPHTVISTGTGTPLDSAGKSETAEAGSADAVNSPGSNPPPVPPRIAALLTGLTALTGAVIGLITSFNAVHWTSAETTLVATEAAAFWVLAADQIPGSRRRTHDPGRVHSLAAGRGCRCSLMAVPGSVTPGGVSAPRWPALCG